MVVPNESAQRRIAALDATRGIAVMGILLINIVSFAMPGSAYINPLAWGGTSSADLGVWAINQLLFEGRMRGLFALLFGASAMLIMDRAAGDNRSPVATHLRRMATLALIGLAHLILVWDGDVLFHYALIGCLIWPLWRLEPRQLVALAIIVLALHAAYWSSEFFGLWRAAHDPAQAAGTAAIYAELPGPGHPSVARDLEIYRGDFTGIVAHRIGDLPGLPIKFLNMLGAETLGYMLLGMALFRSGFFSGEWGYARTRRTAALCYAISLPALAVLTMCEVGSGFDRAVLMGHMLGWSVPFRVACAVGHLCLASLLLNRFRNSRVTERLAAVGRMALTNYLATSIAMTTIFYGYGLDLFGTVPRANLYAFVAGMWGFILLWSRPWLARFRYGPAEWLWRSLARLTPQAMRGAAP